MRYRDKSFYCCLLPLYLLVPAILLSAAATQAQTGNLNRPFEPVILNGSHFLDFSNNAAPISELLLYRYNAAGDSWQQIPWQIDEREIDSASSDTTYFLTGDGLLDDLDEVSFMARDAGDKAPANNWLDNASARGFVRYEIAVADPLATGSQGYVYLYRSTTLRSSPSLQDYVTYVPPPAANGADTIRGISYEEGHLTNGINDFLRVPVSEGGSRTDFLDRLKLRVRVGGFIVLNEEVFAFAGVQFRDGHVRVIRELQLAIQLLSVQIPLLIKYYGYSTDLNTRINLTTISGVDLLRQSFDFDANVSGAKWYNQNLTTAATVDGNADNLTDNDLAVVNAPALNWYMLSSAHGSFVSIFSIPPGLGTSQKFYYRDNATAGTNDGTPDTGTNGSYGESGLWLSGTNISGNIFRLALTNFILGKEQQSSVGETLRNQTAAPLQFATQAQSFPLSVELLAFTANTDRDRVELQWATASENKNLGFYIERRSPSTNWKEIGFVTGNGTTTKPQTYTFVDASLAPGKYYYRLRQVDIDGPFVYSPELEIFLTLPEKFALAPAYPNPFAIGSPAAVLRYQLSNAEPVAVSLRVFNVLGQQVRELVNTAQTGGYHEARWDGLLENGAPAPAGIYFYQLQAGKFVETKKLLIY